MAKFKAKATAGAIMDVNTGEMIALVSLPDYDPNNPVDALEKDRINRINVGVFEMGSTFKALTTAMALDSGKFNINSSLDARSGLRYGKFTIGDYHADASRPHRRRKSSSTRPTSARRAWRSASASRGTRPSCARWASSRGSTTELPENAEPIVPPRWGELNTMTIAFGHGLAVAPLQALMAVGALVNGGDAHQADLPQARCSGRRGRTRCR